MIRVSSVWRTKRDRRRHEYLRVKVVYTDGHGASKTKYGISMNPVRAEVSSLDNGSPDFDLLADTRTVPESTAVGDPVGSPVAATDPDNDTLTYELDDDADPTNTLAALSDLQFFDIDMGTGQIEVAQELDFDAIGARPRIRRRGWNVHGNRQGHGPFRQRTTISRLPSRPQT